jgi:ABC-type transport system involved in multi-copper enzyme maturation permease subunit
MKTILLIAKNTCKEILRDRILYGLIVFAALFIFVSVALGQLSYAEQSRISLDFGLAGMQISALLVAVFVGSTLVSRELEKRTIFTLLTHAVSRPEFVLGKFLGMLQVIFIILTGLFVIVVGVGIVVNFQINASILYSILGIFIEAMILLAVTIFFGVFTTPMMSVIFTISVFLIGHFLSDLLFFATKSESESFLAMAKTISYVFPDLERLNWKEAAAYASPIEFFEVAKSSAYGLAWVGIYLTLATFIFRRRDFV